MASKTDDIASTRPLCFFDANAEPPDVEANIQLSRLAKERMLADVDLNGVLDHNGALRLEMTDEGTHLTDLACAVWADMLRTTVREMHAVRGRGTVLRQIRSPVGEAKALGRS